MPGIAQETFDRAFIGVTLTERERELASVAFRHWHGLVEASVQRIMTLSDMLESMGNRVATVDEFFNQPYSYGVRYNCHRFALEILNRLQNLSE